MNNNQLQEISRRSININKYEDIVMVWHKSYLTLRVDKSLRIFEFSNNTHCTDKYIDLIEYFINVSMNSPASDLFERKNTEIRGIDLSELILDPALWTHSKHILNEMNNIVSFEWSPTDLIWNNKSILAVMNNIGNVEFFRKNRHTWTSELNISSLIRNKFQSALNPSSQSLAQMKETAYILESCAICWAPSMNDDKSVFFVTAQRNGVLMFWLLKQYEHKITAEFFGQVSTNFNEIVTLVWLPVDKQVLLICSNILGQIFLLKCELHEFQVTILKNSTLWAHEDKMVTKHVNYVVREDKIIIICNKHRHLLLLMINNDCKILAQNINNIDDHKLVGIQKGGKFFNVITTKCLYKLDIIIQNETLDVYWDLISIKDLTPTSEFLGISVSNSGALLALSVIDRKIKHRKGALKLDILLFNMEQNTSEIYLLLNNPSKKLTDYWDCIELLRYKTMKTRKLPDINYEQLLIEGETDLYKLKLFLIIATFCHTLEENFKIAKGFLPDVSIECIKDKIMAAHADSVVNNLSKKYLSHGNTLPDIEVEFFMGCKNYLKYFNKKYKANIKNDFIHSIDREFTYICQCCDESISDFSCKNEHTNSFCSLTFTPIETNNYLICKGCGVTARNELFKENPMCIFCDLYLDDTGIC